MFLCSKVYLVDDDYLYIGIIEALHKYYKTTATGVNRYWLCSSAEHYASTYGDKGWGCGYRNLQMQLSSLAKCDLYEQVLFNGKIHY